MLFKNVVGWVKKLQSCLKFGQVVKLIFAGGMTLQARWHAKSQ